MNLYSSHFFLSLWALLQKLKQFLNLFRQWKKQNWQNFLSVPHHHLCSCCFSIPEHLVCLSTFSLFTLIYYDFPSRLLFFSASLWSSLLRNCNICIYIFLVSYLFQCSEGSKKANKQMAPLIVNYLPTLSLTYCLLFERPRTVCMPRLHALGKLGLNYLDAWWSGTDNYADYVKSQFSFANTCFVLLDSQTGCPWPISHIFLEYQSASVI